MFKEFLQLFQRDPSHDRPGRERVSARVEVHVIQLRDRDNGSSRRRPDFVIVQPDHAPAQVHVGPVETKKFAQA